METLLVHKDLRHTPMLDDILDMLRAEHVSILANLIALFSCSTMVDCKAKKYSVSKLRHEFALVYTFDSQKVRLSFFPLIFLNDILIRKFTKIGLGQNIIGKTW